MLKNGDLTTVGILAQWVPNFPNVPPPVAQSLIQSCSVAIRSYLQRPVLLSRNYSRFFDGTGTGRIVIPEWPVTNIIGVQLGTVSIPSSPIPPKVNNSSFSLSAWGWRLAPWDGTIPGAAQILEFQGGDWWRGKLNLNIQYTAGYAILQEPAQVPAVGPFTVTVQQPIGICAADNGVSYLNGPLLTPVVATPGAGQYIPPVDAFPGVYTFSAADANQQLQVSYSFVPADLTEACNQFVGERYSYRSRVGDRSKSLGGQETMTYRLGMPEEVLCFLYPYKSVLPPAIGGAV